jgi:hypothetical protein
MSFVIILDPAIFHLIASPYTVPFDIHLESLVTEVLTSAQAEQAVAHHSSLFKRWRKNGDDTTYTSGGVGAKDLTGKERRREVERLMRERRRLKKQAKYEEDKK